MCVQCARMLRRPASRNEQTSYIMEAERNATSAEDLTQDEVFRLQSTIALPKPKTLWANCICSFPAVSDVVKGGEATCGKCHKPLKPCREDDVANYSNRRDEVAVEKLKKGEKMVADRKEKIRRSHEKAAAQRRKREEREEKQRQQQ